MTNDIRKKINPTIMVVINALLENNYQVYLIGGAVRDYLLGNNPKDLDFEVFNCSYEKLGNILKLFGKVEWVGKSFGAFKLWIDHIDYDFNLPRIERKVSIGYKGFEVDCNSELSLKEAAMRRDFTFNALMCCMSTGYIHDFFNGISDMNKGIIRCVNKNAFSEDPLRVIRAARFSAKYDWLVDYKTAKLCQEITHEIHTISKERLWAEIVYLIKYAKTPSRFFLFLNLVECINMFPELSLLIRLEQNPKWHPEGDVWNHTMMVIDKAKEIADEDNLQGEDRIVLLLAALCHDLGKALCTTTNEEGRIISYGHDKLGEKPTRSFLKLIDCPNKIIERVVSLVKEHMISICNGMISEKRINRLAKRLFPEKISMLNRIVKADTNPAVHGNGKLVMMNKLIERASSMNLLNDKPTPIVQGRHLIKLGIKPGPEMGKILNDCEEAQLEGKFKTLEEAIKWLNE